MSHNADMFSLFCNKFYGKIYIWCFSRNFRNFRIFLQAMRYR
jgi:hypothetical protein